MPIPLSILTSSDATPGPELKRILSAILRAHGDVFAVTLTSAQLLALNATAVEILPAPGVGKAYVVERVDAQKPAGTAYSGIAAGEDLAIKYTNSSGAICAQIETTGFLDQATAQLRSVRGTATDITPVVNAPLVAHMLAGEITTGDSPLNLRLIVRVINTVITPSAITA